MLEYKIARNIFIGPGLVSSRKQRIERMEKLLLELGDQGWQLCESDEDFSVFSREKIQQGEEAVNAISVPARTTVEVEQVHGQFDSAISGEAQYINNIRRAIPAGPPLWRLRAILESVIRHMGEYEAEVEAACVTLQGQLPQK